ncbi:hypothetical protein ACFLVZ_00815 [Chloroflexota bacterium]
MEYLYIGIITLIIIVLLLVFLMVKAKQHRKPSNLVTLSMAFVVFGIVFIDAGRLAGYSFFGVAILLSIIDMIRIHKNKKVTI